MNERDRAIYVMTVYAEARGEGMDGIRAVAHVIWNRFQYKKWYSGATIAATCLLRFQFSCWNTDDKNRIAAATVSDDDPIYADCFRACYRVADGTDSDNTGGATHYYASTMIGLPPEWTKGATQTKVIGRHLFFKDVA